MSEYEDTLEIIDDSDGEDYSYSSNGEDEDKCYYCDADLDYEDNEFYDWESDRYYCERCWNQILHND